MTNEMFKKEAFKKSVKDNVKFLYRKTIEEATQEQIFQAVSYTVKDVIIDNWLETQKAYDEQDPKTVYYMSMEFLMGRALGNNLINLCAYGEVKEALDELGFDLNCIEDQEPDPALGNGGLGRLAACFLDSLATLNYSAYGCGIRYHYGMFKQKIENGYQIEVPDNWLKNGYPFELRRPEYAKEVHFGGYVRVEYDPEKGGNKFIHEGYQAVKAIPYDMPITGYDNDVVNTLRIWDAEPIVDFELDSFDKGDYKKAVEQENLARNIVEVLYPNDNHYAGKELRLKQQYFFVSASLQAAIDKYKKKHSDIKKLYEKVTFQMNDTHPTVAVAELMRILMDEEGLGWDEAWEVTTKSVAYTNHTIMSEALEKWPIELFSRLLPRVYQIIEEINRRFILEIQAKYPGNYEKIKKMAIIYDGQVKMAHLAIAAGYSVNGVARLHTEILKNQELKDFYELMPQKFNNKTNGITQRRFLLHANPLLADWITEHIGPDWITDLPQLKKLAVYADDDKALQEFMNIKFKNKERLAKYILEHNGVEVDPHSIFDVQVKRLHEYKRQLLNILHVIYLYNQIKMHPEMEFYPRTFIFGAKASAGYATAKKIIKLINSVADVVNNDASINGKIKVVFIENYRVSNAEWIFAAADVSEQISTASKEASGTGNMKFMLNGAPTLGTMDGANVEIVEEVGAENAFIFGLSSDEVINYENNGGYDPNVIYNTDEEIRQVLMQLINGTFSSDTELFRDLYDSLLNTKNTDRADRYFILADFRSYADAQKRVEAAYRDEKGWAKKALLNTACSGKFTSDRTIQEYVDDIWHLDKVIVRKK
ncbi:glycogen/starch/alpha-glucan phosphorylase [Ruminococcus sp. AF37-6AT]|jgi:starch phosphorylase|uniref:glycogen/starch/alpha-glucan phosphorylase n=1 Tax=Blautia sp. HCN-1074 TaxID=3134667 RepID=UPI000E4D47C8|nr:glycogen/starch/alpha-glucan phosphorylase [uncultured Blautia sp.]RGY90037.1 glycogen/starch/alpha-glucan phosphorylase [Ruminococcus sp. AM58-7XD]RHG54564.1 glycogen/starch/alpha-glucan phosphorylase [Ruminococcus sp. AM22-13]RHL46858.1 glycogen/starch/alpha-glucan phosphorylase [Ruminococcus sp. AF37-6AT]RHQ65516.1 glycogen/starch/alpha-glucan phosphorylase [Ruminococcus sp. AF24-32LB]RHQ93729.1 glycogen/starch/alpha-glucan phosphorylase [Ruminococcus sp. AF21-3]